MRYIVRLFRSNEVENIYYTNDCDEAHAMELEMRKLYGKDNVWVCDCLLEMLVG